jgi:hypothetical protein
MFSKTYRREILSYVIAPVDSCGSNGYTNFFSKASWRTGALPCSAGGCRTTGAGAAGGGSAGGRAPDDRSRDDRSRGGRRKGAGRPEKGRGRPAETTISWAAAASGEAAAPSGWAAAASRPSSSPFEGKETRPRPRTLSCPLPLLF